MYTLSGIGIPVQDTAQQLPAFVMVRHVAYRCGCVRTYKRDEPQLGFCPNHMATAVSTNDELVREEVAAA